MDLDRLLATSVTGSRHAFSERDSILYALSLGFGADPTDAAALPYVYEGASLRAVPSMAVVMAPSGIMQQTGLFLPQVLHARQRLTLHRALPTHGVVVSDAAVASVVDRGPGKGAFVSLKTVSRLEDDDRPLFCFEMDVLARQIGGIGSGGDAPPPSPLDPQRAADRTIIMPVRPDAALLYRLNGDRNPLHADPAAATRAGFERPILHGLCSYGMACRALLIAGVDPADIATLDARFSAPVYPGETLAVDLWEDGHAILFTARTVERDTLVLRQGRCERR